MSLTRVIVFAEGKNEMKFLKYCLAPFLIKKNINITCIDLQGKIKFDRVKQIIKFQLKKDRGVYVTTMLDYYGIDADWPGVQDLQQKKSRGIKMTPIQIGQALRDSFIGKLKETESDNQAMFTRLIPYFQVHEFEALLFSDLQVLERVTEVSITDINKKIDGLAPEEINDVKETAPKSRLLSLFTGKKDYRGIDTNTDILKMTPLEKMRNSCPNFDSWVTELEGLAK